MIDGDRVETLALAVWARGGQAPLRAQTVILPGVPRRAAAPLSFTQACQAIALRGDPGRRHASLPRKVTFSMPSEFILFGVPIARRADRPAMTPGRIGPGSMRRWEFNRPPDPGRQLPLASADAAET